MPMASIDKRQTKKNRSIFQSVGHAGHGLWEVFNTERNFRYHLMIMVVIIIAGFIFALNLLEWIMVLGCIAAVLVAEILNSAIERLADLAADGKFHPLIKQAKDIAASGVLVTALFAAIIGLLIFGNKLF
ncbi:diacylglycerol kinase family protein [Pediococcus pentosaceus]|nr:diacylglycerol kinase family protein [Pediococcus pentosaceus]UQB00078.1 diacylglycerol kinase family protein [Pediococcus pentosaceus]UQB01921.1 diacylglycerol kinase family protein [Pediococcus pentosaceus]